MNSEASNSNPYRLRSQSKASPKEGGKNGDGQSSDGPKEQKKGPVKEMTRCQQPVVYINPNLMKIKIESDFNTTVKIEPVDADVTEDPSSPSSSSSSSFSASSSNGKNASEFAGERPFKCKLNGCDYAAKTATHLKIHEQTVIHTSEKKYKCRYKKCTSQFSQDQDFKRHLKIHKPKRYKCSRNQCTFSCHQPHALTVHMRVHTDVRPYQCPSCSYAAKTSTHLKSHQNLKHK